MPGPTLPPRSIGVIVFESAACLMLMLLAFFGNVFIIIALHRNPRLRNTTNVYIAALAVTDLLNACIPGSLFASSVISGKLVLNAPVCKLSGFLVHYLTYVSMATMTLTAVNRYFRVVRPQLYNKIFSLKRSLVLITVLWLLVAAFVLYPQLAGYAEFSFNPIMTFCAYRFINHDEETGFTLTVIAVFVVFCLSLVCFSYYRVSTVLRQHNAGVSSTLQGFTIHEIKLTKVLFVLVLAFALCWLPTFGVILVIRVILGWAPHSLGVVIPFLMQTSSAINPLIYGVMSPPFRREFRRLLRRKKQIASENSHTTLQSERRNEKNDAYSVKSDALSTKQTAIDYLETTMQLDLSSAFVVTENEFSEQTECPQKENMMVNESFQARIQTAPKDEKNCVRGVGKNKEINESSGKQCLHGTSESLNMTAQLWSRNPQSSTSSVSDDEVKEPLRSDCSIDGRISANSFTENNTNERTKDYKRHMESKFSRSAKQSVTINENNSTDAAEGDDTNGASKHTKLNESECLKANISCSQWPRRVRFSGFTDETDDVNARNSFKGYHTTRRSRLSAVDEGKRHLKVSNCTLKQDESNESNTRGSNSKGNDFFNLILQVEPKKTETPKLFKEEDKRNQHHEKGVEFSLKAIDSQPENGEISTWAVKKVSANKMERCEKEHIAVALIEDELFEETRYDDITKDKGYHFLATDSRKRHAKLSAWDAKADNMNELTTY